MNSIDEVCRQFDSSWRRRNRIIDSKLIVVFLFQNILSHNTQGYATTLFDLWTRFRGKGAGPRKEKPVAASSMCEARQKLDENIFKVINRRMVDVYEKLIDPREHIWHGLRLFAVDGSKINLPPELFDLGFNQNSSDRRSPQGLASCLYHLKSKIPYDFALVEHGDERRVAKSHLEFLGEGDCVIYDRGYFSYALLLEHHKRCVDAVFRLSTGSTFLAIKEFMDDPAEPLETTVVLMPTKQSKKDIRKRHREIEFLPLKLRVIRYKIGGTTFFLGTTISSDDLARDLFPDLYHSRWGIEEFYKIPKAHLQIENFHSKSARGVKQEVYASFVLVALTRLLTNAAEQKISGQDQALNTPKKRLSNPNLVGRLLLRNREELKSISNMR